MSLRDKIIELVSILRNEDLDEIEVRTFWWTVKVVRRSQPVSVSRETVGSSAFPDPSRIEEIDTSAEKLVPSSEPPLEENRQTEPIELPMIEPDAGLEGVLSPMVGTFYAAPGPDQEPFVSPGQHIEVGQVICIIEAMKLMNEVESEQAGTIRKMLVKDSQPVEFGQPLFLIESA